MKNIVHIPVLKSENRSVNYTNHTAVCTGHSVISTNHTVTLTFLTHKDRLSCRHPQVLAAISLVLSKERSQDYTQQDNKQKACIYTASYALSALILPTESIDHSAFHQFHQLLVLEIKPQ